VQKIENWLFFFTELAQKLPLEDQQLVPSKKQKKAGKLDAEQETARD